MTLRLISRLFATSLSLVLGSSVSAATITRTIHFNASDFYDIGGAGPAPIDPVHGRVTVTFDPAAGPVSDVTSGITLNGINLSVGSPLAFTTQFDAVSGAYDAVFLGGSQNGATSTGAGTADFVLGLLELSTAAPRIAELFYTVTGKAPDTYFARKVQGRVRPGEPCPVPEPATWTMMILGLSLLGAAARSRRSQAAAV